MKTQSQPQRKQIPEEHDPPYLKAWLDYRGRCGLLSVVLAFFLPLQLLLLAFCRPPSFTISFLGLPFLVITSLILSSFRCPRCQAYFSGSRWLWRIGAASCRCCGLPTYTLNAAGNPKLTEFDPED